MTVQAQGQGRVIRPAYISRNWVRQDRHILFVFGDNMVGRGMGGQAAAMRGEINSVGVPTKWRPDRDDAAYFSDDDWSDANVRHALFGAFAVIERALNEGRDVAIPFNGLGTGLAQLPRRAPKIHSYIEGRIKSLSEGSARVEQ